MDIDKHEYDNSSEYTDDTYYDNSSPRADDNASPRADDNGSQRAENDSSQSVDDDDDLQYTEVSHMQLPTVGEKYHVKHDDKTL